MAEIFQKEITVMEYECDVQKKFRLSGFMHHAQQMGSDHLASKGIGYRQMYDDHMVFVVNKLLIRIKRRPEFPEQLKLTTIPRQPKGVQFIRDTVFETISGEPLAEVNISWALINPETRRILRPSVFDCYGFQFNPNEGEQITGYKLRRPQGQKTFHQRQIKYSDLDYNGHVNNSIYADIVCDLLPLEWMQQKEIEKLGILYHREAKPGQVIQIESVPYETGKGWYFNGHTEKSPCFEAEILFR